MQSTVNHYKKIILGGGVAGLFLAKALLAKGDNSFLLIEKSKENLGGYALWGDIKISMLPAGNLTATYFDLGQYKELPATFIEEYKSYLKLHNTSKDIRFNLTSDIEWKNYLSYIFSKENGKLFIENILAHGANRVGHEFSLRLLLGGNKVSGTLDWRFHISRPMSQPF